MRNRVCMARVFVTFAAVGVMMLLIAGCSALGHDNREESAPATDKAAAPAAPGAAIQNNPNIPPQFKAGIIAHLKQMQGVGGPGARGVGGPVAMGIKKGQEKPAAQ